MRFGSSLHLQRVPAWTESYIDYNLLKVLVDAVPPFENLIEAIRSEIDVVDGFLASQEKHVDAHFSAFEQRWGVQVGHDTPSDYQGVLSSELQEIKVSLLEIAHHITRSQLYLKVNRDALSHILAKVAVKYTPEEATSVSLVLGSAHQGHLALRKVNVALQHVQKALKASKGVPPSRSLLLEQSGFDGSPDYLQKVVQSFGRADPPLDSSSEATAFGRILKPLDSSQLHLLQSRDTLGRLPIHYSAIHGLDGVCREIISAVQDSPNSSPLGKLRLIPDEFGLTPLDYAVQEGHVAVAALLLAAYETSDAPGKPLSTDTSDLLATAIASRSLELARLLIQKGWGVRFIGRSGKTVMHLIAEQGLAKLVKDVVTLGIDVDAQDNVRGWTALTTASVLRHHEVVKALIESGAKTEIPDLRKWLAKDYAAYRGHMKVVTAIKSNGSSKLQPKHGRRRGAVNALPERSPSESVIFLHLGTLDLFKKTASVVDIAPYKKLISPLQVDETSLELSISLIGTDQSKIVPLPFASENSDWPFCFATDDPENAAISFKITNLADTALVGTGVALISSLTASLGNKRDALMRDYKVPLVSDELGHVGSVVFTVVTARPYNGTHPPPKTSQVLTPEKSSRLGGHRGNGQNVNSSSLQVGENTIQSFLTAVELGADVVELEKGSDAPMHTLTYKQFMAISDAQASSTWHKVSSKRLPWDERQRPLALPKARRMSLCGPLDSATDALTNEMKNTLGYPGYKSNLRHHSIHEPFVTLEKLLRELPEDIPLDIELKYPMLYEAADFQMDNYAAEINHFLDSILSVTYTYANNRRIIFTSFSPEICMVLAVKQHFYPMLFLNDSSNWPTGDMRATSLQTAVRLAHRFGLDGVTMSSEPFVYSPGTVELVRSQGLYTATYGPLNDDGPSVKIQTEAGVDLIIVNKVKLMRQVIDEAKH